MSAELEAAEQFIRSRLVAQAGLSALVPGGFHSERLHNVAAGRYILWTYQGAPPDTMGEHGVRILVNPLYLVRVIDKVGTYLALSPAADLIDQALHTTVPQAVVVNGANYTIQSCLRERPYTQTETLADLEWRHTGGYYRITLSPY